MLHRKNHFSQTLKKILRTLFSDDHLEEEDDDDDDDDDKESRSQFSDSETARGRQKKKKKFETIN